MCVLSSRLQLHIYFFHYLLRILKICILLYLSDRIYENTLCYYHFLTLIIHRQKLEWKLNNLSFAKCFRLRGKKWLVANAIEQLSSIKRIYFIIASPAQRRHEKRKRAEGGSRAAYVTDCTWRDPTLLLLSVYNTILLLYIFGVLTLSIAFTSSCYSWLKIMCVSH